MDGDLARIRLVPARANMQPALAAYAEEHAGDRVDSAATFARTLPPKR